MLPEPRFSCFPTFSYLFPIRFPSFSLLSEVGQVIENERVTAQGERLPKAHRHLLAPFGLVYGVLSLSLFFFFFFIN